ncbi:MAG: sodium-dependent transporter [Candidatus Hydrogenedentes bacterium]|nr:sodium-dependent transporter [Candidatus Hydrogenedentota bacterium]
MAAPRGDQWVTRFGLIMAMAGNAVGLGNFLRFPGQAAPYGGAFMIPYFLALVLIGIPLMWMEWTIGRHGGGYGHGSTPGQFHRLWHHPISKYLGIFGVLLPAMVGIYYIYVESWSLGYAWHTMVGTYWGKETKEEMAGVFTAYLGIADGARFSFSLDAYIFFLITFAINIWVLSRGIAKGIEIVAKYCMPVLVILAIVLAIRVVTLPPGADDRTISHGLAQIWAVDDWSVLTKPAVWLAAAGQIFFTLSVGLGMVHTYASYLKKQEDVTLNGLASASTNEFVEVILGSTIAIPAAVVFFGVPETREIAAGGTFSLGFYALPVIFQQMAGGQFFGTLWFLLLFLAGLTSSMAMFIPLLVFLEDELRVSRKTAVKWLGLAVFIFMQPIILFMHHGILDEVDYWMGTFGLVLFGAIEAVIFAWIFGMKRGWAEMHLGAQLQVPRIFYYIMQWVTPVFAILLVAWFAWDGLWDKLTMKGIDAATRPYLWLGRGMIFATAAFLVWGVWYAWRTHPKFFETVETDTDIKEVE